MSLRLISLLLRQGNNKMLTQENWMTYGLALLSLVRMLLFWKKMDGVSSPQDWFTLMTSSLGTLEIKSIALQAQVTAPRQYGRRPYREDQK